MICIIIIEIVQKKKNIMINNIFSLVFYSWMTSIASSA